MISVEGAVVTQQQVLSDRAGNVQRTERRVAAGSQVPAQGVATEMLQRARQAAPPTQRLPEEGVLLREGQRTR